LELRILQLAAFAQWQYKAANSPWHSMDLELFFINAPVAERGTAYCCHM